LEQLAELPDFEEWLFIAWVFGCKETFMKMACKLVLEIQTDLEGRCVTAKGRILNDIMPVGLTGT